MGEKCDQPTLDSHKRVQFGLNLECDITSSGRSPGNGICITTNPIACQIDSKLCLNGFTVGQSDLNMASDALSNNLALTTSLFIVTIALLMSL